MCKRLVIIVFVMLMGICGCGSQLSDMTGEMTFENTMESELASSEDSTAVKTEDASKQEEGKDETIPTEQTNQELPRVEPKRTMEEIYELIAEKQYPLAIHSLSRMEDPEARALEDKLRYIVSGDFWVVDEKGGFIAALDQNQKVQVAHMNVIRSDDFRWEEDIRQWEKVSHIMPYSYRGILGIQEDGGLLVGRDEYGVRLDKEIRSALLRAQNVKQVLCTSEEMCFVNADGRVTGFLGYASPASFFDNLEDVIKVVGWEGRLFALLRNGTIRFYGRGLGEKYEEAESWTDIVDIDAGGGYLVALRADGTVLCTNGRLNNFFEYNLHDWNDLISVKVDELHLIGLKRDGTVCALQCVRVLRGDRYENMESEKIGDMSEWKNVVAVDVARCHFAALTADGKVLVSDYKTPDDQVYVTHVAPVVHHEIDTSVFHDLYIPTVK